MLVNIQLKEMNQEMILPESKLDQSLQKHKQVVNWPVRIGTPVIFAATLAINYVIGLKTGIVSDKYIVWITPPGLFFTIWAVIYTLLALSVIYNLIINKWTYRAHFFFLLSNILNLVWIVVFNEGSLVAVCLSSLIIIGLVPSILMTWIKLKADAEPKIVDYIVRNVFAFYLGWVIAAANLNLGIVLVYWWQSGKQTQMIVFWIMAPLLAIGATIFTFLLEGYKGILNSFCLWISVIWAFTGAAIRSNSCLNNATILC